MEVKMGKRCLVYMICHQFNAQLHQFFTESQLPFASHVYKHTHNTRVRKSASRPDRKVPVYGSVCWRLSFILKYDGEYGERELSLAGSNSSSASGWLLPMTKDGGGL